MEPGKIKNPNIHHPLPPMFIDNVDSRQTSLYIIHQILLILIALIALQVTTNIIKGAVGDKTSISLRHNTDHIII